MERSLSWIFYFLFFFPIWLLFIYIIFILFIYVIVLKDVPFFYVWRSIPLACIVESSLHMKNIYEVPNIN